MLIGFAFFFFVPFIFLAAIGFTKPLVWMIIATIATIILALGLIGGMSLSIFTMPASYFQQMPISFITTGFIESAKDENSWKLLLIPYTFVIDCFINYFKISFGYKQNFSLWFFEFWTWILCIRLFYVVK